MGNWLLIYQRINADRWSVPLYSLAFRIVFLFVGGLFNILFETAILLYVSGLFSFAYFIKRKKEVIKSFLEVRFTSIFLGGLAITAVLLTIKNGTLYQDGDFHHWGLIVKDLLHNDRLPNAVDEMIVFKTYVPGTALLVYYFSRFCAATEWHFLLFQNFAMFCCVLPLFSINKKQSTFLDSVIVLIFTNIVCYNNAFFSLHVDIFLPSFAAGILFLLLSSARTINRNYKLYYLQIIVAALLLIKNSAVFFFLVIVIVEIIILKKNSVCNNKGEVYRFFSILSPLFILYIWRKHCIYTFPEPDKPGIATLSLKYFKLMSQGKTKEDCLIIAKKMLTYLLGPQIIIGIVMILLVYIFVMWGLQQRKKHVVCVLGFLSLLFTAWCFGIYITYIVSIPYTDAMRVGSIGRYLSTIMAFIKLVITGEIIYAINDQKDEDIRSARTVAKIILLCIIIIVDKNVLFATKETSFEREWLTSQVTSNSVPTGKSYFFFGSSNAQLNSERMLAIMRYDFWAVDVGYENDAESIGQFERALSRDYIFVIDEKNELLQDWLTSCWPDQSMHTVIVTGANK